MNPPREPIALILGGGALFFGVLGVVKPRAMAWLMGSNDEIGRQLGFRDLGNALMFAAGATRPALAQRLLYEISDIVMFGRRRPLVGAAVLGIAALDAFALAKHD
jgi:hypothetical protein